MKPKTISILLWVVAFVLTMGIAAYQRMTGPTYPKTGKFDFDGKSYPYKLIRTWDGSGDARITVLIHDTTIHARIRYHRFPSHDVWTVKNLQRHGDTLIGFLPHQAPSGKVEYNVKLIRFGKDFNYLYQGPIHLRYKGQVPVYILLPHILLMFLAMLFSTRAGMEAFRKGRGKITLNYTWVVIVTLFLGGLILGPLVQKFAFDTYWSGWPVGHDLTDNKSAVAFIFWVIALVMLFRNKEKQGWGIVASIVLLIVFLIPHSMLGSEIDYSKQPPATEQTSGK